MTTPKKIDWNLDATNQTWKFRENWVIISRSAKVHRNFWNFRTIRFLLQGKRSTSFQPKRLLKLFLSNWDRDGRNHASTNVEKWFWKPRWLKTQPSVRFRTSKFRYKNQNKNFSNEPFSTVIELSIDTLMGETKPTDLIYSIDLWQLQSIRLKFWCNKPNLKFPRKLS